MENNEESAEELRRSVIYSLAKAGDFSLLTDDERAAHYDSICIRLGLNPLTKPLEYLRLNGKLVLYVNRGGTDQLASIHQITRRMVDGPREMSVGGTKLIYAACEATLPTGRAEVSVATVPINDPANVLMRAETKAKRRATLSILGLGMLDETEIQDMDQSKVERSGPAPVIEKERSADSFVEGGAIGGGRPAPRDASTQARGAAAPVEPTSAPAAESRSIELDPDFREKLLSSLRELESQALMGEGPLSDRLTAFANGIADLFWASRSKNDRDMTMAIWRFVEGYAESKRCLPQVSARVKALKSQSESSSALPPVAAPVHEPVAPLSAAPETPSYAPSDPLESWAKSADDAAVNSMMGALQPSDSKPESSSASTDPEPAAPLGSTPQPEVYSDGEEKLRTLLKQCPSDLAAYVGVWMAVAPLLEKEERGSAFDLFKSEARYIAPGVTHEKILEEIKKNKADPMEAAKSRWFSAPTDGPFWARHLEVAKDAGNAAASFAKRAEVFSRLPLQVEKERREMTLERMKVLSGKDDAWVRTKLSDVIKHVEKLQQPANN